jgi:hypothetical protein
MQKMAKRTTKHKHELSPQEQLVQLIDSACDVAKKARKHRKALSGNNFYADKMANLRADATNTFRLLSGSSVGDTSAMAELMEKVFAIHDSDRATAARNLKYELKTTWANIPTDQTSREDGGIFPLVTLNETNRGYLVNVGRQMNECYAAGWYDACAVMMRRLLESSIIEAFEGRKLVSNIKDRDGHFFQLTKLIKAALAEKSWTLPRNVRNELDNLRDLGHRSAHNRYFLAKQSDIDKHAGVYREAVEAFLNLAKLF